MAAETELSERQRREREYYDQYSQAFDHGQSVDVDFSPVLADETRPWNPYWRLLELVKGRWRPGARLLDFGCGWGTNSVLFARIGYEVEGFDVSEGNLEVARKVAEKYGLSDRMSFSLQTAEALDYPDESFDVVAGIDILHHVEIEPALRECRRVLKRGGAAFFREPLSNPVFDGLRNTALVKRLAPNDASFEKHITHDERKLTAAELACAKEIFPQHRVERFRVLSRGAALWRGGEARLEKIDHALSRIPGYGWFGGSIVATLEKP